MCEENYKRQKRRRKGEVRRGGCIRKKKTRTLLSDVRGGKRESEKQRKREGGKKGEREREKEKERGPGLRHTEQPGLRSRGVDT